MTAVALTQDRSAQDSDAAPSVLVCGEALFDVFVDDQGAEASLQARLGGSPCNVAIGLARLGTASALFTGLAPDVLGARLRRALLAEGVDLSASIEKPHTATTLSLVAADGAGVPRYTFYGQAGAERALQHTDLPRLPAHCRALHFGSYSLVVEPTASSLLALAERERDQRLISLDPNVRLGVEPDLRLWRQRIGEWLAIAHVVKVSEEDLQALQPGDNPLAVAEQWLDRGPNLIVVTLGAQGAIALTESGCIRVAAPSIRVVDTVGAGDTFQAALLDGLLAAPELRALARGESRSAAGYDASLRAVLERAAFAAALTCTRAGAELPYRAELEQALASGVPR